MADCIVDLSEVSPVTSLGTLTTLVERLPPPPSAGIPSLSTLAISETTPSPKPPKAHRWYLRESEEEPSSTELRLNLFKEHLPPVKINASKKSTTLNIPLPSDHEDGTIYDIVLGVSTQALKIDTLEAILVRFDQLQSVDNSFEFEVIKPHELERLSAVDSLDKENDMDPTVLSWKLFHPCYGYENGATLSIEFSTWSELPFEYGSLDIHYVELCTDASTLYKADPLYKEHRLHASWLIDINRTGCPEYDAIAKTLKSVGNFSLSGDGRFAAFKTAVGASQYLEVWDLQDYDTATKDTGTVKDKENTVDGCNADGDKKVAPRPHLATLVAWMSLPEGVADISISWDGSLVAVTERAQSDVDAEEQEDPLPVDQSNFAVYKCSRDLYGAHEKPSSRMSLVRHDVERTCPGLRNYIGEGIFHMVDKSKPDPKDELFVACNGTTIDIYSTFENWTPLRSIDMDSAIVRGEQLPELVSTIFNRFRSGCNLVHSNDTVAFTFDIVLGKLVSFTSALPLDHLYALNYRSSLSEDGSLIAIPGFRDVCIYRTKTWTLEASYTFNELGSHETVTLVSFMSNSSVLHVSIGLVDNYVRSTRPGYLLDVTTMSVVGRLAPEGGAYAYPAPLSGSEQGLVFFGRTKVWHTRLEDLEYHSTPRSPVRCTSECRDPSSSHFVGFEEGTSSTGLHFRLDKPNASVGSRLPRDKRSSLVVTMTDTTRSRPKKMVIPMPDGVTVGKAAFYADFRCLMVNTSEVRMAWTVPRRYDEDFQLQVALYASYIERWSICSHGVFLCLYREDAYEDFLCGGEDHHREGQELTFVSPIRPISPKAIDAFFHAVEPMWRVCQLSDPALQEDILRYYSKYLNYYPLQDDLTSNILVRAVNLWMPSSRKTLCDFFKNLLSLSPARWVPLQEMTNDINPVAILLDASSWDTTAIGLLEILVDRCLRQARVEQNQHFLLPILQCIESFVDPKQQHSELVLKIYREMAFLPAQAPGFVIGHHALANPVHFRWAFWKPSQWGLHQYKDQVMQLDLVRTPNPSKGTFSREIYQASFDMLWRKTEAEESEADPNQQKETTPVQTLFSWPHAIWTMVMRKCTLRTKATIECFPFEVEVLDNPALKALVEYKWNTIGFSYWLVRFLGQFVYYLMVLTAIFLQVYGNQNASEAINGRIDSGLEGLFVAIIVVASVFLWLELVQWYKDKRSYIRTIYNWVDLFVFLLPLTGSINQILIIQGVVHSGLNPGLLSFSVLFIFLHFLFELRVFQVVCHFVSIIIRAIYSIRVFFFVFAGGLLAFSIAIVHLMYACTGNCDYFTEGFSRNLLRAFSVTYFMMGGNYDQVQTGFTSNNIAFHVMMMVFFFFTVIVMLNVLIALINNAINDGDQTWQRDWLDYRMRYVESAENMTYDILNFRETRDYFPDTIYYTVSPKLVKEYQKKTRQLLEESVLSAPEGVAKQVSESSSGTAVAEVERLDLAAREPQGRKSRGAKSTGLTATELREQLHVERANSEKQIGELQQQLRNQQQSLSEQQKMLAQILGKLDR